MTEKTEKSRSQCWKILRYLKTHKSGITQVQAAELFGCYRLGGRIWDLRHEGHDIETIDEVTKNDEGYTVRYARYVLR